MQTSPFLPILSSEKGRGIRAMSLSGSPQGSTAPTLNLQYTKNPPPFLPL